VIAAREILARPVTVTEWTSCSIYTLAAPIRAYSIVLARGEERSFLTVYCT
jgi:hypothetical protein